MTVPVVIDMTYDLDKDSVVFNTGTNVKKSAMAEVMEGWIRTQIGLGEDKRAPNDRKAYHIRLELDLVDDSFRVSHDCGNDGLCLGIVMNIFNKLPKEG